MVSPRDDNIVPFVFELHYINIHEPRGHVLSRSINLIVLSDLFETLEIISITDNPNYSKAINYFGEIETGLYFIKEMIFFDT